MSDPSAPWQVTNRRPVLDSAWLRVDLAEVIKPSGQTEEHHLVWLPPAAVVVVLDDAGEHVLLAWRHRCVPDVWGWEIVGGLIEDGEEPIDTARRELLEETGHRPTSPQSLRHLVTFEPAVGSTRNPHHVFLAHGVDRVADPTESDEGTFRWVPLKQVPDLIARGEVTSAGALIGLLFVLTLPGPGASAGSIRGE